MKTTVMNNHCKGCVWGKQSKRDNILFCPFVRCVHRYGFSYKEDTNGKSIR